jgi:hypothetical protein
MSFLKRPAQLEWTLHAKAKMNHYRLTPSRVRHVLHTPKRVEEGIAPNTIAMMQPVSMKIIGKKESWSQEIWVMMQDKKGVRTVISAWRYPGVTKVRDAIFLKKEYDEFLSDENQNESEN